MSRILCLSSLLLSLVLVFGCGGIQPEPTRTVQVPTGGPPVLTSSERAVRQMDARSLPRETVSPASFEQPLLEPRPLKPFEQWTEQDAATDALGRIGSAAVPPLVEQLQNPDPLLRRKAVEVLGRMGPTAEPAVPDLIRLLDDPDEDVRKAAARTLGRIGPAAQAAVPALMQTLFQPAPQPQ